MEMILLLSEWIRCSAVAGDYYLVMAEADAKDGEEVVDGTEDRRMDSNEDGDVVEAVTEEALQGRTP